MTISLKQGIELILKKPLQDLRKLHKKLFPEASIPYFREHAIKNIAYKLQEIAYGKLSQEVETERDYLISQKEKGKRISNIEKLLPGTEIIFEYKGKTHTILVTNTGYVYEGQAYNSPSALVFKITGTRWNGHRFLKTIMNR